MSSTSDSENGEELGRMCQCVVCLQTLTLPVTWSCGHSFCKSCSAGLVLDMQGERGIVRCPNCRKFANMASVRRFAVNTVLNALLARTFPDGLSKREKQVSKDFERFYGQLQGPTAESGFAGENGGAHTRGYELIVPSEKFLLKSPDVHAERNVVRDAEDWAMHLSLAPISSFKFVPCVEEVNTWKIKFAFLEMEEDEASEGFPLSLYEHDDSKYMDMSLIRQTFESPLKCEIKLGREVLETVEADAVQGIAEFDIGEVFNITPKQNMLQREVTATIKDEESGLWYSFKFKVFTKRDNPRTNEHLKRVMKRKKKQPRHRSGSNESDDDEEELRTNPREEEGESLTSSGEEEEEEEEEDSLDGFIVSEDDEEQEEATSPSPTPLKRGKKPKPQSEDVAEIRPVKGSKKSGRSKPVVHDLVSDEEDEDEYHTSLNTKKRDARAKKASEEFIASFITSDSDDGDDKYGNADGVSIEDEDDEDFESEPDAFLQRNKKKRKKNRESDDEEEELSPVQKKKYTISKKKTVDLVSSPSAKIKKIKKKATVLRSGSGDDDTPQKLKKQGGTKIQKSSKLYDEEEDEL